VEDSFADEALELLKCQDHKSWMLLVFREVFWRKVSKHLASLLTPV